MRVFRFEVTAPADAPCVPGVKPIRENRYGAWAAGYNVPFPPGLRAPQSDTKEMRDRFSIDHFCAFPNFDWPAEAIEEYGSWLYDLLIVEYEVEPDTVSDCQVIFTADKARLICEIPVAEFLQ